jgi:LuxR family transcriptional regulator, maltose regulon positive regulatory protein
MSMPILSTKLHAPAVRPDWILRQRLIEKLDEGLNTKLTLISAPTGYGKTSLISAWLQGLEQRLNMSPYIAWLSLEEEENELSRFLSYLVAAWQESETQLGQSILPLLDLPQLPSAPHLITLLINELAHLPRKAILILNDYHVIHRPETQNALIFLVEHLPGNLHLVIASREEPRLPLARLRVQRQVTEIRQQDLRFTLEESKAFFTQTMGLNIEAEDIEKLENRTEGWIAGLQMAALSLRGAEDKGLSLHSRALLLDDFSGTHQYVMDYLAAEVLRQQSTDIRAFLRQTAILDRMNAALCDAVTGQSNSRQFLSQLEQANLFLSQLDEQRQWYRYHALFMDFLRTDLAEWEKTALHQRASAWYEANGFIPEAVKHALAAKDLLAAARLIRACVGAVLSRGGFNTLLTWLNALPDNFLRQESDLSAYKAWMLYLRGQISEAEKYAIVAIDAQNPSNSPIEQGILLGFRAYRAISRNQIPEAIKFGEEALAAFENSQSFFRTTALSHLGQALRIVGERRTAIQTLRQAVSLGEQLEHDLISMEALGYLSFILYQQGELREALQLCEAAIKRHRDSEGQPFPVLGLVYIPLGLLYFELNDLQAAHHALTTGIALCEQMGTVYFTLAGQRILAKLYFVSGESEKAWEVLTTARHLAAQSENLRRIRMVNVVTAELQLRQGQIVGAAYTLADLPASVAARSEQENLVVARLLLAQGEVAAAQAILSELEALARQQGRLGSLVAIYVLQALCNQALQQSVNPDPLREALSLAVQLGYYRSLFNEAEALAPQLLRRREIAPDFVDSLLATVPALSPDAPKTLLEPLSKTQLFILGLVADGLSNQEIADNLGITVGTTKWHLSQIYRILNVSSRTQAMVEAKRLSLL